MEDKNAKRNRNKTVKNSYTNLGTAYKAKMFVLLFVGLVTVACADTFESTLIGTLTTLSGICFDLVIVSISNYGPRQKWIMRMAKFASSIIICICISIIVYFIAKESEMVNSIRIWYLNIAKDNANLGLIIIKIIIIIFSVIGPLTEYYYNKPNDNFDDEEEN